MKRLLIAVLSIAVLSPSAWAAKYEIDSGHSSIGFKIKHLAISNVPGKFTKYSGTFEYDPNNVAASKADATIKIASIDTEDIKRDDHLRSADFFDIEKK